MAKGKRAESRCRYLVRDIAGQKGWDVKHPQKSGDFLEEQEIEDFFPDCGLDGTKPDFIVCKKSLPLVVVEAKNDIIAIANQKGGVGKTTTTSNLGIGLAKQGKRVLLVDADAQGSLTASLGFTEPDKLEETLATVMANIINDVEMEDDYGILRHEEGIDLMPGNIELSGLEVSLVNVMSREVVMRSYIEKVKERYDYILIDCMPSLGMITINAFACADSILIPVQAAYLPVKGLEQLIKTIGKVKRQINPKLSIEGILLTMVDSRTNYAKAISALLIENYGSKVRIFENSIPISVRAAEISAEGVSIYQHDPKGKVASAYQSLMEEVLGNE